jgi:hypothetical protein
MKTQTQTFTIWTPTSFGIGCRKIKAKDFNDAFNKLGKKDKANLLSICDSNGEEKLSEDFN